MIDSNFLLPILKKCKFGENNDHLCLVPSEFGKVTSLGGLDNVEYGKLLYFVLPNVINNSNYKVCNHINAYTTVILLLKNRGL